MAIETFAIIAVFILGYGLVSKHLETSIVTPPMVFVSVGLLLGPLLGLLSVEINSELVKVLAEMTLIVVLFTDAARIDLKLLKREHRLPERLLSAGLPLTILLGMILALVLFRGQIEFWEAGALATILAPTDAALGQAVVVSPQMPIRIRQALSVESGLNDGVCLPILLIFLSLAGSAEGLKSPMYWLGFIALQVFLGPITGVVVGYIGGKLLTRSVRHQWITESFEDLSVLGLSLVAFALAKLIGGNGFLAVFCAGLTLGNTSRSLCQCLYDFGEAEGQLLVLLIFLLYGAAMVVPTLNQLTWTMGIYAIASLTFIRIISVTLSLLGQKLRWETLLVLGWFGPRGLASVIYGLLVLEQSDLSGSTLIFNTAVVTVLLSIFAHGMTAAPGASYYARRMAKAPTEIHELQAIQVMPTRFDRLLALRQRNDEHKIG